MTSTKLISVKIPLRIVRRMPEAGHGRSSFIVAALEEKISRQKTTEWKAKTQRGQRLEALLKKGFQERAPLLDRAGIAAELAERRGHLH